MRTGESDAGTVRSFFWQHGTRIGLGSLGGQSTEAMAINDVGQIVGWSDVNDVTFHAFVWQHRKLTDLGGIGPRSRAAQLRSTTRARSSVGARALRPEASRQCSGHRDAGASGESRSPHAEAKWNGRSSWSSPHDHCHWILPPRQISEEPCEARV
jgi:probable HAF family extracellular repeat protein